MESQAFLAIGEEATRGTKEATTVGYIPIEDFSPPAPDFMPRKRTEHRGESTPLGPTTEIRMGQKWEGFSPKIPMFSEAGTVEGMIGTILKHFMGKASSVQNAATGQYAHIIYAVADMFGAANLGTKALTLNANLNHESVLKNYPYTGGRVKSLKFDQEVGQPLYLTPEFMGQKLDTITAGLSSPVFPAENLRLDYNNLNIKAGATVTRTGSAPDYTDLSSDGAAVTPDSMSLEISRGLEDRQILNGSDTVGKTGMGVIEGKLSMVFDFEDPAAGFSSIDDFELWLAGTSETNFLLTWDSGTQAGTGDNHSLIIDLPRANRLGGMPEINLDGDPKITLEYDFHYDLTTTLYALGMLLKNTATAV